MELDLEYCYDFILSDYKGKFLNKYRGATDFDFIHIKLNQIDLVTCIDVDDNLKPKYGFCAVNVKKTKLTIDKAINSIFKYHARGITPNIVTKKTKT